MILFFVKTFELRVVPIAHNEFRAVFVAVNNTQNKTRRNGREPSNLNQYSTLFEWTENECITEISRKQF